MPGYRRIGQVPRKRHIEMPHRPGYKNEGIYYEEVVTLNGFSRAYSIVYHLRPPTRVRKVEPAGTVDIDAVDEPALRHHHIKTAAMKAAGDPISGRVPIRSERRPAIGATMNAVPVHGRNRSPVSNGE